MTLDTLLAFCAFRDLRRLPLLRGALEPACLLVYGPGKYRFGEFGRAGLPLSLIVLVTLVLLVPRLWSL